MKRQRDSGLTAWPAALAIAGLVAGCSPKTRRHTDSQYLDDATITTNVETALSVDRAVKSFAIEVETERGMVRLVGSVATSRQKSDAGKDASAVRGVLTVLNQLDVK